LLDAATGKVDLTHAPDDLDFEVSDFSPDDSHVLSTALPKIKAELFIGGRSVWLGGAPGEILLTGPRQGAWRGSAAGDIDNFRVFLPQALMAECYIEAFGHVPSETVSLLEATVVEDDKVRYPLRAFRELDGSDGLMGPCLALGSLLRLVSSS
jgi:AraC family transcriptional regulator